MDYYTQCIVFDREGNTVYPIRIKREWQADGTFGITECETITWQQAHNREKTAALDWDSNRFKPETRAELIASGVIRLPGDGQKFLSR